MTQKQNIILPEKNSKQLVFRLPPFFLDRHPDWRWWVGLREEGSHCRRRESMQSGETEYNTRLGMWLHFDVKRIEANLVSIKNKKG
jgi:hypothetical protein